MLKQCGKTWALVPCWWECKIISPLWVNNAVLHQKLKNRIITWFSNSISGYILKRTESRVSRRYVHTHVQRNNMKMFITALFIIAKMWKQPKRPLKDEWKSKMWYTYNIILFSLKKAGNSDTCDNMDTSWGYYAKWNMPVTKKTNTV